MQIENINILKGLAIILVMIGHSTIFKEIKDLPELNTLIYSFHMPLFFIIGGFFLKMEVDFVKVLKRLLMPFLIASVFWAFFAPYLVQLPTYYRSMELYPISYDLGEQTTKFFKAIFYGTRIHILGTGLWFLVALSMARVIWSIVQGYFKVKITIGYILIVFTIIMLLYYNLKLGEKFFYWMWPQSLLGYLFIILGNYMYKKDAFKRVSYFDVLLLVPLLLFLIKINGRVDMSSFGLNNFILFFINAVFAFVAMYKLSSYIEKKGKLLKTFFVWCGKNSLNIFLFHPFLLAIVPYVLMANFNIQNVYERTEFVIMIYSFVLILVLLWNFIKAKFNGFRGLFVKRQENGEM